MIFLFDLDDTLVAGDIVFEVSAKLFHVGLIDKIYSNANCDTYDMASLPKIVQERVKQGFADPELVWVKKPIVGSYYFLRTLEELGNCVGIVTARPKSIENETKRFLAARFPKIRFEFGINFINENNNIDMKNIPTKKTILEKLNPQFYFDDNQEYCEQANSLGIETYLVSNKNTPWNHAFAEENKSYGSKIKVIRNVAFFPESRL